MANRSGGILVSLVHCHYLAGYIHQHQHTIIIICSRKSTIASIVRSRSIAYSAVTTIAITAASGASVAIDRSTQQVAGVAKVASAIYFYSDSRTGRYCSTRSTSETQQGQAVNHGRACQAAAQGQSRQQ
jgi:hypothetical protein